MKLQVLVLVLAISVSGAAFAKDKADKKNGKAGGSVEQQVKELDDQARQAAISGDTSFQEKYLADDFVAINPMGHVASRDEAIAMRKNGDIKYSAIDQKDQKIHVYGNTAVVTSTADVKGTNKGNDISGTYQASRVWVKRNGKWQQVLFQSTKVSEPN
jgi:hypothetical protein